MSQQLVEELVAVAIFILIAFPVHEFSHAFAAFRLGDSTARWQGRLTLNPVAHFDPLGGAVLVLSALIGGVFIGWAKPTPVNPYNLRYGRRGESVVALAGPISNLIMAAIVAIPLRIITMNPSMFFTVASNDVASFIFDIAGFFVLINVFLMVFNLLPIPPLDGWHVLLGLVDARTAYSLRAFEQYGFLILILIIFLAPSFIGNIGFTITNFLLGT